MEVQIGVKKTSKVKEVTGSGDWKNSSGDTFYNFNYLMEDGQTVSASHKVSPSPFPIGSNVDYMIKTVHETYGNKGSVGKVSDFVQNTNKPSQAKSQSSNASFATSYAKDIFNTLLMGRNDVDSDELLKDMNSAIDIVEAGAKRLNEFMNGL